MAVSDEILTRLLDLHPKSIDLSLERLERLLVALKHPENHLPPTIHLAGTNGKGSVLSYMATCLEAAGAHVHSYTSPHLVRFHERIRLAGESGTSQHIDEYHLSALLEECEMANDGQPITFFEITTAAAFLAFSRQQADFLLLETGLGGRLDATNVIDRPALTILTSIDLDHQQYLGDTLEEIAAEKAGILKPDVPCIVAPQKEAGLGVIERIAATTQSPLLIANQDWQAYEQHGRLVYQDEAGLLDLPLPRLAGRHQIENAGTAIAGLRALDFSPLTPAHIEEGLRHTRWPARLERLEPGALQELVGKNTEIWLDGGHNPHAARAVATALADLEDRVPKPVVLILGMLNTKEIGAYLVPFKGLCERVITVRIPGEENAVSAEDIAAEAVKQGFTTTPSQSLEHALKQAASTGDREQRLLICGSLYLAGNILKLHRGNVAAV